MPAAWLVVVWGCLGWRGEQGLLAQAPAAGRPAFVLAAAAAAAGGAAAAVAGQTQVQLRRAAVAGAGFHLPGHTRVLKHPPFGRTPVEAELLGQVPVQP